MEQTRLLDPEIDMLTSEEANQLRAELQRIRLAKNPPSRNPSILASMENDKTTEG